MQFGPLLRTSYDENLQRQSRCLKAALKTFFSPFLPYLHQTAAGNLVVSNVRDAALGHTNQSRDDAHPPIYTPVNVGVTNPTPKHPPFNPDFNHIGDPNMCDLYLNPWTDQPHVPDFSSGHWDPEQPGINIIPEALSPTGTPARWT